MEKVWSSQKYYDAASAGSGDLNHPGMKLLVDLAKGYLNVLDLGCGEGTRLNLILGKSGRGQGLDISSKAVKLARKKYPKLKFQTGNLEKLPFKKNSFELVYSAYVLEHLTEVKWPLLEAIRVSKKNLVLICPNYGSPNRSSPNFTGSRISKLILGFLADIFGMSNVGSWRRVFPKKGLSESNYQIDDDTLIEPYAYSLLKYLTQNGMNIKYWTTCWEYELQGAKLHQKLFHLLALLKIFPFKYWGPHIVVHAVKN